MKLWALAIASLLTCAACSSSGSSSSGPSSLTDASGATDTAASTPDPAPAVGGDCSIEDATWKKTGPSQILVSVTIGGYETISVQASDAEGTMIGSKSGVFPDGGADLTLTLSKPAASVSEVSLAASGTNQVVCDVTKG